MEIPERTRRRGDSAVNSNPASIGFGVGGVIAGLISWEHTHSLGWTILHVLGSWIYVIYSWATGKISW